VISFEIVLWSLDRVCILIYKLTYIYNLILSGGGVRAIRGKVQDQNTVKPQFRNNIGNRANLSLVERLSSLGVCN